MYLYNSYCYENLDSAAASFYSRGYLDGVGELVSYSLYSLDTVDFTVLPVSQVGAFNPVYLSMRYRFSECFAPGFDNSFFGITPAQSLEVSGAVVMLLVAAFKFKILKKFV